MNKLYNESIDMVKNNKWIKDEDKQIIIGFIEYLRTRVI